MEVLKTISVDIQHSVFENDTAGVLYVTRDIYDDSYIVAVPVFCFSCRVRETHTETDYEWIRDNFPTIGRKYVARLVEVIQEVITKF